MKEEEYPEDDIDLATTAPPMRDFLIPSATSEPAHTGGADAFGSMLDTSPLGTMMPPMRKLGEPVVDDEIAEDREIQPASAHTAFEGFSPWRASASSAGVVEEEETSAQSTEEPNQSAPSSNEPMGRVWEIDPNSDKSPEETIIEPHDDISPLTHSSQHVTSVRSDASMSAEIAEAPSEGAVSEAEPSESSRVSDWRSAFAQAKEESAQIVESSTPSMSPWSMPTAPAETFQKDHVEEVVATEHTASATVVEATTEMYTESVAEAEPLVENNSAIQDAIVADTESANESSSYPAGFKFLKPSSADVGTHESASHLR